MENKGISLLLGVISLIAIIPILFHNHAEASFYVTTPYTATGNVTMVPIDLEIDTNTAIGSTCPTTSYTKVNTGTTIQYDIPNSVTIASCRRGAYEFNISELPTDATITGINLIINVTAVSNAINSDINSIESEIKANSASAVWTDIGDGTTYQSNNNVLTTTGQHIISLGSGANSNLQTAVAAKQLWWGVGIKANDETRALVNRPTITMGATENTVSSIRPSLQVSFTTFHTIIVLDGMNKDGAIASASVNTDTCPATYATTATTATTSALNIRATGISGTCTRNYYEFDSTNINDAVSSVSKLVFEHEISAVTNGINCDINDILTASPSSASAANLWTDIGDGSNYISNNSYCTATGVYDSLLSTQANTDMQTQVNTPLNWFGLGLKYNSETRTALQHQTTFYMSEETTHQKPRLVVDFTISKTINQALSIGNTPTKAISTTKSDTISFANNLIKNPAKVVNDNINVAQNVLKSPLKVISDNIGLTESSLIKNVIKAMNEPISIVEDIGRSIGASVSEFMILMDNIDSDENDAGINWGFFAGLFVVIPMIILLPIVAIKRRRR